MTTVLAAAIMTIVSAAIIAAQHIKTKNLIDKIDLLLKKASEGNLECRSFEESEISRIESDLFNYNMRNRILSDKLEKQRDGLASLISDISHQTKTPLANIKLYSELLSELDLSDEASKLNGEIKNQTQKLGVLMDALSKSSRLENGIIRVHPKLQTIVPLVERAARQYEAAAKRKNQRITVSVDDSIACFDMKWTEEILCNLLDNAVKYSPKNSVIALSSDSLDSFVEISVSDSGPGLSEEESVKIFGRFYRSQEFSGEDGLGLGLYLAQQIASAQGAFVSVKSIRGKGSVFSIFLRKE